MNKLKATIFILFFAVFISSGIYAADFSIKYGKESNGNFVNAYSQWNRTVPKDQIITTPKVSDRADGTRCYWIVNNKKGASYEVQCGDKYTVSESVNMYAVWKLPKASYKAGEYCIRYGRKTNGVFENNQVRWNRNANMNQLIKLPAMNDRPDGTKCYWVDFRNSGVKIAGGGSYTVKGDTDFYVVWEKDSSVEVKPKGQYIIRYGKESNGAFTGSFSKWDRYAVKGQIIKTPWMNDRADGTRCYWTVDNKKGAEYEIECGDTYTVVGSVNMYAVWKRPKASYKAGEFCIRYGKAVNGSFSNTYEKWNRNANRNQIIKLPQMSDRADGSRCFWLADNKTGTGNEIQGGGTYTVSGDMDFYAVWKEKYTVKFYNTDNTSEYSDLRTAVYRGDTIELPSLSDTSSMHFTGWKEGSGTSVYKAGAKVKINRNVTFSAVFTKLSFKAVLRYQDGSLYKEITLTGQEEFPSVDLPGTKTLQGWSRSSGKANRPEYLEEDKIPNGNGTYYMVVSDIASEQPVDSVRESSKYEKIYFVGDSRMVGAKNQFGKNMETASFIAKGGIGYNWLVEEGGGYEQLIDQLLYAPAGNKAVIFALGINDLKNIDLYINFYLQKASELRDRYGCDLYVMSANQFCRQQRYQWKVEHGMTPDPYEYRNQKQLKVFNSKMKNLLNGTYSYIDINTYLRQTGWATWDGTSVSDGLHYSVQTNKRIINRTIEIVG